MKSIDKTKLMTAKCANCTYFHSEEGCLLLADASKCIANDYFHFTARFTNMNVNVFQTLSENYCRKENK